MKRLKFFILIFFIAISVPLAFVVWQTYSSLEQEERSQLAFFSETLLDQMEKELAYLVQEEENRAVDEYQYFLAQRLTGGQNQQQVSPLADMVYEKYILGYLQNNPDGSFQTPLVLDMGRIPQERKALIVQLQEANRIFNSKKYSLPRQKTADVSEEGDAAADTLKQDRITSSFSERYLARSKNLPDKVYLGKKKQRTEEISAEQALNVASEDESISSTDKSESSRSKSSPATQMMPMEESKATMANMQAGSLPVDRERKEDDALRMDLASSVVEQVRFQVEVAPFQSVSIKDDQVYIFRRIAINNQIYRQGFILLVKPLLEHLLVSHFSEQPLADFTSIQLQRRDNGKKNTIVQAGIAGATTRFLAERVFPAPFDFLSVTLNARTIPPSPARSSLRMALMVLGLFMFFGLLAIYQSARTIVAMSERRSQFVSSVTHELKTPLTNIRMYIEMLEHGIANSPEREQEYLAILSSESARLSGLINNVLELAKLEKKQRHFQMEEGHLGEVLAEVRGIMSEKLKQEGFTLEIQATDIPLVSYDRDVLIQVMINLLENSIKFGRHATTRNILIRAEARGQYVRIAVSDTGPGIPKYALKRVFDDFYRVDNTLSRSTGGTGIGLALVKKFVTAMGGRVSAANNAGPGCTISVYLPAS